MQVQDTRLLHVACALMALAQPEEGGLQSASEGGRKALVKTVFAAIADPLDVLLAQELVRQRHGLQEPAAVVSFGDTVLKIAQRYGLSLSELRLCDLDVLMGCL